MYAYKKESTSADQPRSIRGSMQPSDASTFGEVSRTATSSPQRFDLICAADVEPEVVSWLWPNWLPFGKLVSIDGVAGVGKSTLVLDLIARATRGDPMPETDARVSPVTVVIAGVEDGFADTVLPRLRAAKADEQRVHWVKAKPGKQFTIPRDVFGLMEEARKVGAKWLHIDAIMGTLDDNVNANNDPQVRRALGVLQDAAAADGLLVTFIRHPRKAGGLAVVAGGGSVAFSALARVCLFVGWHTDDLDDNNERRRVLAVSKSNLGRSPSSLVFDVAGDERGTGVGVIEWQGTTTLSADDLSSPVPLAPKQSGCKERHEPRSKERAWVRDLLDNNGRMKLDEIRSRADNEGLQWHRVKRAADDEKVIKERGNSFPSHAEWSLPRFQSAQSAQSEQAPPKPKSDAPTALTVPSGVERPINAGPGNEPFDWRSFLT